MDIDQKLDLFMKKICEHQDFQFCKYHVLFERLDELEKNIEEIKMDAKIKKIQKTNAKEGKQLSSLLKADKKQDKKIEKCKEKI